MNQNDFNDLFNSYCTKNSSSVKQQGSAKAAYQPPVSSISSKSIAVAGGKRKQAHTITADGFVALLISVISTILLIFGVSLLFSKDLRTKVHRMEQSIFIQIGIEDEYQEEQYWE